MKFLKTLKGEYINADAVNLFQIMQTGADKYSVEAVLNNGHSYSLAVFEKIYTAEERLKILVGYLTNERLSKHDDAFPNGDCPKQVNVNSFKKFWLEENHEKYLLMARGDIFIKAFNTLAAAEKFLNNHFGGLSIDFEQEVVK